MSDINKLHAKFKDIIEFSSKHMSGGVFGNVTLRYRGEGDSDLCYITYNHSGL